MLLSGRTSKRHGGVRHPVTPQGRARPNFSELIFSTRNARWKKGPDCTMFSAPSPGGPAGVRTRTFPPTAVSVLR